MEKEIDILKNHYKIFNIMDFAIRINNFKELDVYQINLQNKNMMDNLKMD